MAMRWLQFWGLGRARSRMRWAQIAAVCTVLLLLTSRRAQAYDYFEHRFLGDVACALVQSMPGGTPPGCMLTPPSVPAAWQVSFGDLVAMAGDHFETPKELQQSLREYLRLASSCSTGICDGMQRTKMGLVVAAREVQASGVRTWLRSDGHLLASDLSACGAAVPWLRRESELPTKSTSPHACQDAIEATLQALLSRKLGMTLKVKGDCYETTDAELGEFARTPDFGALANSNAPHYGDESFQQWQSFHQQALTQDDIEARITEAFALHFLTDRYSSGHLRTQRKHLSNTKALWFHDHDNVYGLIVKGRVDNRPVEWQTIGDRCLLGHGAEESRAMTLLSAVRSLRQVVAGKGKTLPESALPTVESTRNPPVPAPSQILSISLRPFSGLGETWLGRDRYAYATGVRLEYRSSIGRWWTPPDISQLFVLLSSGQQCYIPLAVEFWQTAILLTVTPILIAAHGVDRGTAESRRVRDIFDDLILPLGALRMSINFFAGFGLINGAPSPVDPTYTPSPFYFGIMARWKFYDRWSFSFNYDHLPGAETYSIGLGINL